MEQSSKQPIFDIVKFAFITLAIVIPIRAYIAQPFIVSGISMDPTYENGEYLIIDELTYHFTDPKRGEVVVFRYPKDPSKFFIKRMIALPGETVLISRDQIKIITTEEETITLEEPYISTTTTYANSEEITLGEDEYFVLGDNRMSSLDSRSWGAVPRDDIQGRVFLRLLPITRVSAFPGDYSDTY